VIGWLKLGVPYTTFEPFSCKTWEQTLYSVFGARPHTVVVIDVEFWNFVWLPDETFTWNKLVSMTCALYFDSLEISVYIYIQEIGPKIEKVEIIVHRSQKLPYHFRIGIAADNHGRIATTRCSYITLTMYGLQLSRIAGVVSWQYCEIQSAYVFYSFACLFGDLDLHPCFCKFNQDTVISKLCKEIEIDRFFNELQ